MIHLECLILKKTKSEMDYLPRVGNSINSSGLSEPTPGSRGGSFIDNRLLRFKWIFLYNKNV